MYSATTLPVMDQQILMRADAGPLCHNGRGAPTDRPPARAPHPPGAPAQNGGSGAGTMAYSGATSALSSGHSAAPVRSTGVEAGVQSVASASGELRTTREKRATPECSSIPTASARTTWRLLGSPLPFVQYSVTSSPRTSTGVPFAADSVTFSPSCPKALTANHCGGSTSVDSLSRW